MGQLTNIDAGLPAHLAAAFGVEANNDLSQGVNQSFPILSYKGKVWHVVEGDTRSLVANPETEEPMPSVEVVILRANPKIGKTYYPDGYEEGSSERPTCHSNDSEAPAPDAQSPQAAKCAICPHNQFGSKITENGARGKACSDFRRLAVAPAGDLERAMLLRVPAASLKELVSYSDLLNKRKAPYNALVTRIGFDHTVAYPKLSFKFVRWLGAEEVPTVLEMVDSDLVATITAMNAPTAAVTADDDIPPPPAHVANMAPAEPVATAPAKRGRPPKTQATPAEVEAAVSTVGGFGGGTTAAPAAPVAEPKSDDKVAVLMSGAASELDAVLSAFDD